MKPLLISFLTLFLLHSKASCQTPIKLEDINKHIGDSVKICNKIYAAVFFQDYQVRQHICMSAMMLHTIHWLL